MWRELAWFAAAGTLGFVVDAGVLYLALAGGAGPYAGRVISFLCAAWVTWRLNRRFAFPRAGRGPQRREWSRYLLAMSGGGLVNYAVYCVAIVGLPEGAWRPLAGVAAGSLAGLSINFLLAKAWVFRREGAAPSIPRVRRLMARIRSIDLDAPQTTRAARLTVPLAFGVHSLWMGVDGNWDLYNYHLYNPHALLNGKLHVDLAPAGMQTYFNPLLDVPYYLLSMHLPWPLAGFSLGVVHGINFILVLEIARRVLAGLPEGDRNRIPLLLSAAGVLTAHFLSELGNTMGDNTTALFCLGSLLLLLAHRERIASTSLRSMCWVAAAGLLMGLGAGLKLTNAIFAVALCAALVFAREGWVVRIRAAFIFGLGVLLGIAATGGFWFHEMWESFGNPLFPQFGALFPNALARGEMVADTQWRPNGAFEVALWPILFSLDSSRIGQVSLRQVIWPIAYLSFMAWAILAVVRRARRVDAVPLNPRARLIVAFVAFGYVTWLGLFSIGRYLVTLELLLPAFVFILLSSMLSVRTARRAAAWLLGAATLVTVAGGVQTWGHKGWSWTAFEAEVPAIPRPAETAALIVGEDPAWAWLAAFFPPEVSFIQLGGSFPEGPGYKPRVREMLSRRAESTFAILPGARDFRLESVVEANGYARRMNLTTTEAGCDFLRWATARLRLRAALHATAPGAGGLRCELTVRPGDEKDVAAENRAAQRAAQPVLARYDLALVPEACVSHRGRVGQAVAAYQWCRVTAL